jgi:hypothetical protein
MHNGEFGAKMIIRRFKTGVIYADFRGQNERGAEEVGPPRRDGHEMSGWRAKPGLGGGKR